MARNECDHLANEDRYGGIEQRDDRSGKEQTAHQMAHLACMVPIERREPRWRRRAGRQDGRLNQLLEQAEDRHRTPSLAAPYRASTASRLCACCLASERIPPALRRYGCA